MGRNNYFSGHNLKNTGRKQKVGYAQKYVILIRHFYFKSCIYLKVDFKMVKDPFDAGSTSVESEKRGYRKLSLYKGGRGARRKFS